MKDQTCNIMTFRSIVELRKQLEKAHDLQETSDIVKRLSYLYASINFESLADELESLRNNTPL